jgi:hypothetical protein
MTQSPKTGQAAPASTESDDERGSDGAQFTSTPISGSSWAGGGQLGGATSPGMADSPTASVPAFTDTRPPATPPSSTGTPPSGPSAPAGPSGAGAPPRQGRVTRNRGPRRARLQLRHINPWTVLKFSCVLSIALFFVWLIVIGVLYGVLDGAGVIQKVNDTVVTINGKGSRAPITANIVFGGAAIVGVVNIVLFIALSTVGSIVYNLCADLVGGIEITLSER